MLGLSLDASYANERLELGRGDRILLYTDGIPEAQSPAGEFLDVDRITDWLASASGEDAAEFADVMLRNLRRWRGASSFEDDVTFVTARIVPTPGPLR
jgi:sigma-B regulation protein RsbU (phosphoserine phosphatase)